MELAEKKGRKLVLMLLKIVESDKFYQYGNVKKYLVLYDGNYFGVPKALKWTYRFAFLLFTWFFTGFILTGYIGLLKELMPVGNAYREYLICGGQIIFQGIMIGFVLPAERWNYLGNMMTISFAGALLLLPGLLLAQSLILPALFYALYFMGVAAIMFLEHIRRTKLLKLGNTLTITWVAYRIMILLLILLA